MTYLHTLDDEMSRLVAISYTTRLSGIMDRIKLVSIENIQRREDNGARRGRDGRRDFMSPVVDMSGVANKWLISFKTTAPSMGWSVRK
jgi:hypothetical protein